HGFFCQACKKKPTFLREKTTIYCAYHNDAQSSQIACAAGLIHGQYDFAALGSNVFRSCLKAVDHPRAGSVKKWIIRVECRRNMLQVRYPPRKAFQRVVSAQGHRERLPYTRYFILTLIFISSFHGPPGKNEFSDCS